LYHHRQHHPSKTSINQNILQSCLKYEGAVSLHHQIRLSHHNKSLALLVHRNLTSPPLIAACASTFPKNQHQQHHQLHRANPWTLPLQSYPEEHLKANDEHRKSLEGVPMLLDEACHMLNAPKLKHTTIPEQLQKKNIDDEPQLS
jgi:hypothetical protein